MAAINDTEQNATVKQGRASRYFGDLLAQSNTKTPFDF
jgi:hypothetical protein